MQEGSDGPNPTATHSEAPKKDEIQNIQNSQAVLRQAYYIKAEMRIITLRDFIWENSPHNQYMPSLSFCSAISLSLHSPSQLQRTLGTARTETKAIKRRSMRWHDANINFQSYSSI